MVMERDIKEVRKMAAYLKDNLPENSKIGILSKTVPLDYERFSNYDGGSYISTLYPNLAQRL